MNDLIKREDAIKVTWQEPSYTDAINVLTEVRERIKDIPSAEKQGEWIDANEDAISREWILKEFDKGKPMLYQSEYFAELFWLVRHAPAVEPKQGEWISLHNGKWKCSECGIEVLIYAKGNFCPNCGARMIDKDIDVSYKIASDQRDYDSTYEPTYNEQDGSM